MTFEIGRICRKTIGKEAGRLCVIIKTFPKEKNKPGSFVLISGPRLLTGVKRRRCNVMHLEPLEYVIDIKEDASDEEIIKAYEKAGLIKKFNLKKPPLHKLKETKTKEEKMKEEVTKKKTKIRKKKSTKK
jgi:large subunit ribosomal protein L14e